MDADAGRAPGARGLSGPMAFSESRASVQGIELGFDLRDRIRRCFTVPTQGRSRDAQARGHARRARERSRQYSALALLMTILTQ
jgi:hypothetical protein